MTTAVVMGEKWMDVYETVKAGCGCWESDRREGHASIRSFIARTVRDFWFVLQRASSGHCSHCVVANADDTSRSFV